MCFSASKSTASDKAAARREKIAAQLRSNTTLDKKAARVAAEAERARKKREAKDRKARDRERDAEERRRDKMLDRKEKEADRKIEMDRERKDEEEGRSSKLDYKQNEKKTRGTQTHVVEVEVADADDDASQRTILLR